LRFFRRTRRLARGIGDAFRITRAADLAAHKRYSEALELLDRVVGGGFRYDHEVRLLRGALYCLLDRHDDALDELVLAARLVKADKLLAKAEANYLILYAIQYFEYSLDQLGTTRVRGEVNDALSIEPPVRIADVPRRLRRNFPLRVEFPTGIVENDGEDAPVTR
jgi:hypothetical protein